MDLVPPDEIAEDWETVRTFFSEQRALMDQPNANVVDVFMVTAEVEAAMNVIMDYHIAACL